jgi:hypothetical protein
MFDFPNLGKEHARVPLPVASGKEYGIQYVFPCSLTLLRLGVG